MTDLEAYVAMLDSNGHAHNTVTFANEVHVVAETTEPARGWTGRATVHVFTNGRLTAIEVAERMLETEADDDNTATELAH